MADDTLITALSAVDPSIAGDTPEQALLRNLMPAPQVNIVPFFGSRWELDGSIGRGCLSQWWYAWINVSGERFMTCEHYMMWRKALMFGDTKTATKILAAGSPRQAKALGRQVINFNQAVWEEFSLRIVAEGNYHKFAQHTDLREVLLATGDAILVEASPYDKIWGAGIDASNPAIWDPAKWPGRNLLGQALMAVRELLRTEALG